MVAVSRRVTLMARDPRSADRLRKAGASRVETVADMAFVAPQEIRPSAQLAPIAAWARQARAGHGKLVVLNTSSTLSSAFDQVAVFSRLVEHGAKRDCAFILLPHDSRGAHSDEFLAAQVAASVDLSSNVLLIPHIMRPAEVMAVTALADFTVTGRMHLAILSAVSGTPSISISYQGKVEGLYEYFGLDCWIDLGQDAFTQLRDEFDRMLERLEQRRDTLRSNRGRIVELAQRNFAGLNQSPKRVPEEEAVSPMALDA